jgi:hypothetical protein
MAITLAVTYGLLRLGWELGRVISQNRDTGQRVDVTPTVRAPAGINKIFSRVNGFAEKDGNDIIMDFVSGNCNVTGANECNIINVFNPITKVQVIDNYADNARANIISQKTQLDVECDKQFVAVPYVIFYNSAGTFTPAESISQNLVAAISSCMSAHEHRVHVLEARKGIPVNNSSTLRWRASFLIDTTKIAQVLAESISREEFDANASHPTVAVGFAMYANPPTATGTYTGYSITHGFSEPTPIGSMFGMF